MKQNILILPLLLFVFNLNAQKNQLRPTTQILHFGDIDGFLGNIHQSKIKVKGYTGKPYKIKFDYVKEEWDELNYYKINSKYYPIEKYDFYYFNPLEFWKKNECIFSYRNLDTIHTYLDWGISRMYIQSNNIRIDSVNTYGESKDKYGFLNEEILENGQVKRHIVDATPFFQPFYFKKTEVTNWEYRRFTNFVKDSIAHDLLGDIHDVEGPEYIDWDAEVDWNDMGLDEMFNIDSNRFSISKAMKSEMLIYNYKSKNGELNSVKVYPDTNSWVNDYPLAYNEPMLHYYFSHPSYDNFPVVGITYHQAKAYCHWLEKQINFKYRDSPYEFNVDLPTAYQWHWMAWNEAGKRNKNIVDEDWNADLMMKYKEDDAAVRKARRPNDYIQGNFYNDGSLYTHPVYSSLGNPQRRGIFRRAKRNTLKGDYIQNIDVNGIAGMGGNVSEWMRENYTDNWKIAFERYINYLEQDKSTPDVVKQIALYYNEKHAKDGDENTKGQLVYGANWLDERYNVQTGKNKAGIFAKTFVARNQAYSTLGFRYVIEVSLKNKMSK